MSSTDATPEVLRRITTKRRHVRAATLRRNCGKSLALSVGLRTCARYHRHHGWRFAGQSGGYSALLAKLDQGNDMVNGWRMQRQDTFTRKIGSRLYTQQSSSSAVSSCMT
jgi:hypothetical protein